MVHKAPETVNFCVPILKMTLISESCEPSCTPLTFSALGSMKLSPISDTWPTPVVVFTS